MTLNLYSDPALAATYVPFGSGITQDGSSLIFDAALNTHAMSLPDSNADFIDRIALGGQYHISVHVSGYDSGDARAKLCLGGYVQLGITGDGWSDPVPITAGTIRNKTLGLFGQSGGTTLTISPDENGEAIRITT